MWSEDILNSLAACGTRIVGRGKMRDRTRQAINEEMTRVAGPRQYKSKPQTAARILLLVRKNDYALL